VISLLQLIDKNTPHILFSLGILLLLVIIFQVIIIKKIIDNTHRYRDFMRGTTRANLEEHLFQYSRSVKDVERKIKELEYNQAEITRVLRNCIQNVGLIRFNAYDDMGGELSFALAVLNSSGDGVVLSGLYGRNDSRVYAKPIEKGESSYPLSEEEESAIENAISKRRII